MHRLLTYAALAALLGSPGVFASETSAGAPGEPCPPVAAKHLSEVQTVPAGDASGRENPGSVASKVSCPQAFPGLSNFAEVSKGRLYRSAQPTIEGLKLAKERFGVRTVVNLRTIHSDRKEAEALGLQYHRIPFAAWHVTPEEVVRFLKIVSNAANQPVLVHCQHGADRTGAMVAVYRMFAQGWTPDEAIGELPRFGFHSIYANLKTFLRDDQWRRAAEQAGIPRDGLP